MRPQEVDCSLQRAVNFLGTQGCDVCVVGDGSRSNSQRFRGFDMWAMVKIPLKEDHINRP